MGRGRSKKSDLLVAQARETLEVIQPASVRAVCYQLFTRGLIPSMAKKETDRVSRNLVWARENNIIPWQWIVDETREAERPGTWSDPEAFAAAALRSFRRDRWDCQPVRVEVWSEKGTVRGTLAPILEKYGVTFRVFHGFNSATAYRDIADEARDRPLRVFYVGDYDPSGLFMSERDAPRRLLRYGAHVHLDGRCLIYEPEVDHHWRDPAFDPRFDSGNPWCYREGYEDTLGPATDRIELLRLALVEDDLHALPYFAAKKNDPRHDWYTRHAGTSRAWELDAMDPRDLRERVETAIINEIEPEAWERTGRAEQAEQDSLRTVLGRWQSILGRVQEYGEDGEVSP